MSSSPLSQSQIDALLASLAPSKAAGASPAAPSSWDIVGEDLAAGLAAVLGRAWRRFIPDMVISRGTEMPGTATVSRVVRLGTPLSLRLWLLWSIAGHEDVYDAVLSEITALLPTPLSHQWLPGAIPVPEGAIVLPFRGHAPGYDVQLTIALEDARLAALREVVLSAPVLPTPDLDPTASGQARPDLAQIEVDVTVYVGGGMYTLRELAGLHPGSILTLATEVSEPAVLAINGRVIAHGEVVVGPDNSLSIRITELHLGAEQKESDRPAWLQRPRGINP